MTHWLDFLEQQLPRCKTPEDLERLSNVAQSAQFQGFLDLAEAELFSAERDRYSALLRMGEPDGQ